MIRKGDTVVVIRGEDKGKTGRVLSVDPKKKMVVVQRVRLVQRHQKPGRSQQIKQGTVEKELPIHDVRARVDRSEVEQADPGAGRTAPGRRGGQEGNPARQGPAERALRR